MKILNRRLWLFTSLVVVLALVALACGAEATPTPIPATATSAPSAQPTATSAPAAEPTSAPSAEPTATSAPAAEGTATSAPAAEPTATSAPITALISNEPPDCYGDAEPLTGGTLKMIGYDPGTYDLIGLGGWDAAAIKSFTHSKLTMWNFCDPTDDGDLTPYADLAESWEVSADGLTYTFHIRPGVKWQDVSPLNGRELVADDVVFSYNRLMSEDSPHKGVLSAIDSIEATDRYTVVFHLSRPWSAFLAYTGYHYFAIEAPEILEEFGTFDTAETVIGTGPWILLEQEFGVRLYFEKNPDYYRGANGITGENLPHIDNIEVLMIFDDAAKMAMYRGGELDVGPGLYYFGWWTAGAEVLQGLEDRPDLTQNLQRAVENFTLEVGITPRLDEFPMMNQKVRQAVSMVLDRSRQLWYDGSSVETRELTSTHPWFLPLEELGEGAAYYPVDADGNPSIDIVGAQAKLNEGLQELIDQGLAPAGFEIGDRIVYPVYIHRVETIFEEAASVDQANLAEIGIDLDIRVLEYGEILDKVWDQWDFEGAVFDWVYAGYPDPMDYFANTYLPGSVRNYQSIDDPELTALIEAGMAETDELVRREIVEDLQRMLAVKQYIWQMPNWISENIFPDYMVNYGSMKGYAHMGLTYLYAWFTEGSPPRLR